MKPVIIGLLCIMLSACSTIEEQDRVAKKFAIMSKNTPKLISVLNKFPKGGDLHNHASGAAYIEYSIIYAISKGYYFDTVKNKIILPPKNLDNLPNSIFKVDKLVKKSKEYQAFINVVSSRGWHKNTTNGSNHFFDTFSHLGVPNYHEDYLARIIARSYSQNIKYLELMTSVVPHNIIGDLKILLTNKDFSTINNYDNSYAKIKEYLNDKAFSDAINKNINDLRNKVDTILKNQYNITITGNTPDIIVRYIPQLKRMGDNHNFFITAAASMQAAIVNSEIFGPNIVQNEASIQSLMNFDSQMAMLSSIYEKNKIKPKMSLHAGELVLSESPLEPMRNRISKTITDGNALRIGHGVAIAWEDDVTKTLKMMSEKGIAVEICLSSNDSILGVSGKDHPLHLYLKSNVPVTLATDDEGVSRSNLTMEYVRAVQEHNITYSQLKQIAKNALEYSFLDGDGIYDNQGKVLIAYANYVTNTNEIVSLDKLTPKEYLQILHERDLISFEKKYFK